MIKDNNMNSYALESKIDQIALDIEGYSNAIINTYGKEDLPQATKDYYQEQISELNRMKSELERLIKQ
jgi:uncharacterized coiled-coil DUF342 family protein